MKSILYLEFLQSRQAAWKIFLVVFVAAALMQVAFAGFGTAMAFLILLPQAAGLIGLGTFAEELNAGQIRFLYALPLRRMSLWWVKLFSGLLGAAMVAVVVWAGVTIGRLLRPSDIDTGLLFELLAVSSGVLIAGLIGYSLYTYSAGLFAILASRSQKLAQFLNIVLAYVPVGVLLVATVVLAKIPSLIAVALALAAAGVVLGFGSLVLYLRRNPFDESVSLAVPAIITFVGAMIAFVVVVVSAADLEVGPKRVRPDRILVFDAAPEHQRVLIANGVALETNAFLLDKTGKITADLGPGVDMSNVQWNANGVLAVHSQPVPGLFDMMTTDGIETPPASLLVFDPASNQLTELQPLEDPDLPTDQTPMAARLLGWTPNNRLLVQQTYWSETDGSSATRYFLQDVAKDSWQQIEISGADSGEDDIPELDAKLTTDGSLIWSVENQDGRTRLVVLNLKSMTQRTLDLPESTQDWLLSPDGDRVLVIERRFDEDRVEDRLLMLDWTNGEERILLAPPDLPTGTLAQAARNELPYTHLTAIADSDWAQCTTWDEDGTSKSKWLVSMTEDRVITIDSGLPGEDEVVSLLKFSPNGRFLLTAESNWDDVEEVSSTTIRTFELEDDGLVAGTEVEIQGDSPEWFGDTRLLYLRTATTETFLGGYELWLLDLETGDERRFFNAEWSAEAEP